MPNIFVSGLGKVKSFDARQRLGNKNTVQDARIKLTQKKRPFIAQKISAPGSANPEDARNKLVNKTKFVDARVRIENKKAIQNQVRKYKIFEFIFNVENL